MIDFSIITENLHLFATAFIRLFVAVLLGGFIGWEREHVSRPAGLRTHILVCTGSALAMITAQFITAFYGGTVELTRMGSQVISSIGFLGAGTIIKEGLSVRGLTTAASLWAISSVGIAVGAGFYAGAIAATVLMFFVLEFVKRILRRKTQSRDVYITCGSIDSSLTEIFGILQSCQIGIVNSEISAPQKDKPKTIRMRLQLPKEYGLFVIAIEKIRQIEEVANVRTE